MNKKELIESLRNEYIQGLITEDYYKGKNWGINIALGLVNQLEEPEITEEQAWEKIAETYNITTKQALRMFEPDFSDIGTLVPQWFDKWVKENSATTKGQTAYHFCVMYSEDKFEPEQNDWIFKNKELAIRAILDGYTVELKNLQVIVKNYDSTVYKTDIPEDEAMKLIEGWKEDEVQNC